MILIGFIFTHNLCAYHIVFADTNSSKENMLRPCTSLPPSSSSYTLPLLWFTQENSAVSWDWWWKSYTLPTMELNTDCKDPHSLFTSFPLNILSSIHEDLCQPPSSPSTFHTAALNHLLSPLLLARVLKSSSNSLSPLAQPPWFDGSPEPGPWSALTKLDDGPQPMEIFHYL